MISDVGMLTCITNDMLVFSVDSDTVCVCVCSCVSYFGH